MSDLTLNQDQIEEICQEYESFLNQLEGLAIQALATGEWDEVFAHINQGSTKSDLSDCFNFQEEYHEALTLINRLLGEASTKDLAGPGADFLPTDQTDRIGD
jgi:hypothetical protein